MQHISKFSTIIFDFDGTIVDLSVDWTNLRRDLSSNIPKVSFSSLTQGINKVKTSRDPKNIFLCYSIISQYENIAIQNIKVNQTIKDFISARRNRHKLAICSSNLGNTINQGLKSIGLLQSFDIIIGNEHVEMLKPDPEGLLKIIRHFKSNPSNTIFIGDKLSDSVSAANTKIRFQNSRTIEL